MPYKSLEDRRRYSRRYYHQFREEVLAKSKIWRDNNKGLRRTNQLRTTYGITDAEFNALWAVQKGRCAICTTVLALPPVRRGTTNAPCLDHDHTSGKLRGLLCMLCNRGLGNFKDSVEALKTAADYVRRHQRATNRISPAPRVVRAKKNCRGEQRATQSAQDSEE